MLIEFVNFCQLFACGSKMVANWSQIFQLTTIFHKRFVSNMSVDFLSNPAVRVTNPLLDDIHRYAVLSISNAVYRFLF